MYTRTVLHVIAEIIKKHPTSRAIEIGGEYLEYVQLQRAALSLADQLINVSGDGPVALFSHRSFESYISILAVQMVGRAYLPINIMYPLDRVKQILKNSCCRYAIVSNEYLRYYGEKLLQMLQELSIDALPYSLSAESYCKYKEDDSRRMSRLIDKIDPSLYAYILYTSGTTGEPKGIAITHRNLLSYIDYVLAKYPLDLSDRCSQTFDLTFDPSVHDIFTTWSSGACLCPLSRNDLLMPNNFINENKITVWYSVPSIVSRMMQSRMLKDNAFPNLRYSLFSGEALHARIAEKWSKAAPNSRLINYYGPTEVTINITDYEYISQSENTVESFDILPLGEVFSTHRFKIVDKCLNAVNDGEEGELLLSGPQVAAGYLNDPTRTVQSFIKIDDESSEWYRTGDRVTRDDYGRIRFLGRVDHQIKLRGYRIEIREIENIILGIKGIYEAVVVVGKDKYGSFDSLHAFVSISSDELTEPIILNHCRVKLPEYMVPKRVHVLQSIPLTLNGKIDRKYLETIIGEYNGQ